MIPNSLLTDDRLRVIERLLQDVSTLEGCAMEVGCYQCGLLAFIASKLPHKSVYGFDTFSGLPDLHSQGEHHKPGEFAFSLANAIQFVTSTGLKNITLRAGLFPQSLGGMSPESLYDMDRISFAHIDVDYGGAITECLEWIAPRIVHRGVIVIDDYGNDHCPNVKPAVDAFVAETHGNWMIYRPVPWQAWLRRAA